MPDGSVAERDYMRHVGAVGVVALDAEDGVVLVRQYRHPLRREMWELPAGLIDVPGEPLVDAAARELAEEADLRAGPLGPARRLPTRSPGCSDEVIRLFLARDLSDGPGGRAARPDPRGGGHDGRRVPLRRRGARWRWAARSPTPRAVIGIPGAGRGQGRGTGRRCAPVDEPLPN